MVRTQLIVGGDSVDFLEVGATTDGRDVLSKDQVKQEPVLMFVAWFYRDSKIAWNQNEIVWQKSIYFFLLAV